MYDFLDSGCKGLVFRCNVLVDLVNAAVQENELSCTSLQKPFCLVLSIKSYVCIRYVLHLTYYLCHP